MVFPKIFCRTCISTEGDMAKIENARIVQEDRSARLFDIVKLLCDVQLSDCHENVICSSCVGVVTQAFQFQIQCQKANEFFKNWSSQPCEEPNEEHEDSAYVSHSAAESDEDTKPEVPKEIKDEPVSNQNDNPPTRSRRRRTLRFKSLVDTEEPEVDDKPKTNKPTRKYKSHKGTKMEKYFSCKSCSKSFKNKYILIAHEKRHAQKGQFLCNECGKGFSSRACLTRHTRVHTGEKNYSCGVCSKKFPSSNNLKLHSRIHTGIKPYLCTICGKAFSHPTGLTYHTRTHTKEKPYTCEVCGKSFAIQCHIDRHRKTHSGERPFRCGQCDRGFIKKIDLQRHESIHAGLKPHVCTVCNKAFLRKMHLNYHLMVHTKERPHVCSVCGRGFIRRYYLKDHMIKRHGIVPKFDDNSNNPLAI